MGLLPPCILSYLQEGHMFIRVAPSIAFLLYSLSFALIVWTGIAVYRVMFEKSK